MEHTKTWGDIASLLAAFATLAQWLPTIAALVSLIWTIIRIVEWWKGKGAKE